MNLSGSWEDRACGDGLPCVWISLVVGGTGRVDALVTSSHVEAHPVGTTLDVLLQALINICGHNKHTFTQYQSNIITTIF